MKGRSLGIEFSSPAPCSLSRFSPRASLSPMLACSVSTMVMREDEEG